MQGREATEDDLSDHNVHELLYADSGYRFECGGLTPDIARISNAKVREYHKQHYAPSNSLILVHGQLSQDALESALDEWTMHAKVLKADCDATQGSERAWCRVPAALAAPASRTVDFGAEDEAVGSVVLGWSGPMIGDVVTITALEVLFRFLQEGSASPLAQHFVECAHPLGISCFCLRERESEVMAGRKTERQCATQERGGEGGAGTEIDRDRQR